MDNARDKINQIPGLSKAEKRSFAVVLDEVGKIKKDVISVKDDVAAIKQQQAEQTKQQTEQTKLVANLVDLVNALNEKLTTNNIESKAAQMDLVTKAVSKKKIWIVAAVIVAAFVFSGIGLAYIVEHSRQVAEIGQAIK